MNVRGGFERELVHLHLDRDRIIAIKAGQAEVLLRHSHGLKEALDAQIAERVRPDEVLDLLN